MTLETRLDSLYQGDMLDVLYGFSAASVDMIYLDPPFASQRDYQLPTGETAFSDRWQWDADAFDRAIQSSPPLVTATLGMMRGIGADKSLLAYLASMTPRLLELCRVLKPTGDLFLHCDPTASHYLKLLLDAVFGIDWFAGEIAWKRAHSHTTTRGMGAIHDNILHYSGKPRSRLNVTPDNADTDIAAQRIISMSSDSGDTVLTMPSASLDTLAYSELWIDVDHINAQDAERTGYPTQKPLELLRRIVTMGSIAGDIVLDPFCGSGTTLAAARELGRRYIGIDVSRDAIETAHKRLAAPYQLSLLDHGLLAS